MGFKQFIRIVPNLLFPRRARGNRQIVDFSDASACELIYRLSKIRLIKPDIIACLPYKHPAVRSLVWNIKTRRDRYAYACAGYVMAEKMRVFGNKKHEQSLNFIIVPMPVNMKRRRERGYNQCELLARALSAHCDSKHVVTIAYHVLFRARQHGAIQKQAFKKRAERITGMKDAFGININALKKIENFAERNIIVIDDVLTTGSTMNEAIATLRTAGCANVSGFALAH